MGAAIVPDAWPALRAAPTKVTNSVVNSAKTALRSTLLCIL